MAFLLFAVVVSAIGISIVLVKNRPRNSMDHSIAEFERGRKALAPEPQTPPAPTRRPVE